jgi:hypothetical protein
MYVLCVQIFGLFDAKRKGAIGFGDFVRALSVFHPNTLKSEKAACMLVSRLAVILIIFPHSIKSSHSH